MARKSNEESTPKIRLLSDKEFEALKIKEDKGSFMQDLLEANRNPKHFSIRDIKKPKETPIKKPEGSLFNASIELEDRVEPIDEFEWNTMLDKFDELSPIDDITEDDQRTYRRSSSSDEDEFDKMFKKEKSMLNEVLSDIQKRSKVVNSKITAMGGGKGVSGVSKNFSDLVSASSSLDSSRLQVIKSLVDIKKTVVDLRLKNQKANPQVDEEDIDTVADNFYKSILRGGGRDFTKSSMNNYDFDDNLATPSYDNDNNRIGYNLSQPLPIDNELPEENTSEIDKYGYIRNELRNVSVCVQRDPDGQLSFAAVDEEGIVLAPEEYELPDPILLESINIRPMSTYAYDEYNRKYKILDIDESCADLSDLDDDKYDEVTNDDKYSY